MSYTHVVITWIEGHRRVRSVAYPITRRTAQTVTIADDEGRELTFSRRRSGNWVRKHQIDSVMSDRIDDFLTQAVR